MPVLEEYWQGALARINAEVQTFTRLIRHSASMGTENEAVLGRLLERLLPRRYNVGTGMIIDSLDNYSNQTDLVIYDRLDQPALFAQSTELIYPIETVTAAIEVKTRLATKDIQDLARKVGSLRRLRPNGVQLDGAAAYNGGLPYFAVLAYDSQINPATLARRIGELPRDEQPDLLCVIEQALLITRNGETRGADPNSSAAGICFMHRRDEAGGRVAGDYVEAHEEDSEPAFSIGDVGPARVEPARALLLFLQAFTSALAIRVSPAVSVLSLYVSAPVDEITALVDQPE